MINDKSIKQLVIMGRQETVFPFFLFLDKRMK